jgi:hypothetical protein
MVRESLILSFSLLFLWFCRFFMPLIGFAASPSSRWSSSVFFWFLDLLAVLHVSWNRNSKLCVFCCQCTHQGGDWETKWLVPWFDCDESLTCHDLNLNPEYFICFTLICLCGESCLLVSWCVSDRCDMMGNDEDWGRSRRPGVEDRGWSIIGRVLGGWTIERSGGVMCSLYHAQRDEERNFLPVWPQNWWLRFLWFGLKTTRSSFLIWASKPSVVVWWFDPQNHRDVFLIWALKPNRLRFISCSTKPTGGGQRGTRIEI